MFRGADESRSGALIELVSEVVSLFPFVIVVSGPIGVTLGGKVKSSAGVWSLSVEKFEGTPVSLPVTRSEVASTSPGDGDGPADRAVRAGVSGLKPPSTSSPFPSKSSS